MTDTQLVFHPSPLTALQAKLQVVLSDDEDGHGLDEEEEGKRDAEGAFSPLLQPEVMGGEGEENLSEGL